MDSSISEGRTALKLRASGLTHSFRRAGTDTLALEAVSFDINTDDFVCIVGPSGCGKTTLLRMVAGLIKPGQGSILVDGQLVSRPGQDRMVLFQEAALFPWLTAIENVEFALKLQKSLSRKVIRERAEEFLSLVGLKDFSNRYVHELSGGMKQRVALARALAPGPKMLLMDEPFAALDAMTREQLYYDLQRIWATQKITIILVTHNVREAVSLGNRVLVMSSRPGKLCEEFAVSLPRPRDINDSEVAAHARKIRESLQRNMQEDREL